MKFGGVWILHYEISEFEFYTLNFGGVFGSVWILYSKVSEI